MKLVDAAVFALVSSVALAQDGGGAGVIVLSAPDGPIRETEEALDRAKQEGFRSLLVMLENTDQISDEELLLLIEDEVMALAAERGFEKGSIQFQRCPRFCQEQ